jgi:hypothetical protein
MSEILLSNKSVKGKSMTEHLNSLSYKQQKMYCIKKLLVELKWHLVMERAHAQASKSSLGFKLESELARA